MAIEEQTAADQASPLEHVDTSPSLPSRNAVGSKTPARPVTVSVKAHGQFGTIAEFRLPGTATVGTVVAMLADRGLRRRKIVLAARLPDRAPESMGGFRLLPEAVNPNDVLQESQLVGDCITSGEAVHLLYMGSFEEDYLPLRHHREQEPDTDEVRVAEAPKEDTVEDTDWPQEPVRTADDVRYYKVVAPMVAVRSAPSTKARKLGGLATGDMISGWPYKVGVDPWLRMDGAARPSWVLIHGACVGLGQLLEVCEPGFRPPPVGPSGRRAEQGAGPARPPEEASQSQSLLLGGTGVSVAAAAPGHFDAAVQESEETQQTDAPAVLEDLPQESAAEQELHASMDSSAEPPCHSKTASLAAYGPPVTWSTSKTAEFMKSLGFDSIVPAVLENGVDGPLLLQLTDEEMKSELGLKPLQIKKIRLSFELQINKIRLSPE